MTEASKTSRPVAGRLDATVRRRPLLERLEALRDKSGPYGKLIREAAAEVRAAQDGRRAAMERAANAESAWAGEPRHACDWCVDDDGVWYTGCGHAWQFEDGGPTENGAKWCAYCGGRLSEAPNVGGEPEPTARANL